jgi:2,3-dihydroxybenzoate decarboxylase
MELYNPSMLSMRLLFCFWVSTILQVVFARLWNDTGTGTIIFEEAWTVPALIDQATYAQEAKV